MTRYQSALSALVSELLEDPDLAHEEVFRRLVQARLQDLIDAEASAKIETARYKRTPSRSTRRNGTRTKRLATRLANIRRCACVIIRQHYQLPPAELSGAMSTKRA